MWRKKATRKHQYAANEEFMEEVHVHIDQTEYRSEKPEICESWMKWSSFTGWRESRNVFVFGRNLNFVTIPKGVLTPEQQNELRLLLQSHLGSST